MLLSLVGQFNGLKHAFNTVVSETVDTGVHSQPDYLLHVIRKLSVTVRLKIILKSVILFH